VLRTVKSTNSEPLYLHKARQCMRIESMKYIRGTSSCTHRPRCSANRLLSRYINRHALGKRPPIVRFR